MRISEEFFEKEKKEWLESSHIGNIIVVGKTGVGKSTLINTFIGKEVAPTGIGDFITQEIAIYQSELAPIQLYDTKGLGLENKVRSIINKEIFNEIKKSKRLEYSDEEDKKIHACWYCLDSTLGRIEDTDIEWINALSIEIPVIIVLTKAYPRKKARLFASEIENMAINYKKIIPIYAKEYKENGEVYINSYGIEELCSATYDFLPEKVKEYLMYCPILSQEKKVLELQKTIKCFLSGHELLSNDCVSCSKFYRVIEEVLFMSEYIANNLGIVFDYVETNNLLYSLVDETETSINNEELVISLLESSPFEIQGDYKSYKSCHIQVLMWALLCGYLKTCDIVLLQMKQGIPTTINEVKVIYKSQILDIVIGELTQEEGLDNNACFSINEIYNSFGSSKIAIKTNSIPMIECPDETSIDENKKPFIDCKLDDDYEEIKEWFTYADCCTDKCVQFNIAVCYHDGCGVNHDNEKAKRWLQRSAEQGYYCAKQKFEEWYGESYSK